MSFTLADLKKAKGGLEQLSTAMAKSQYQTDPLEDKIFKLQPDKAGNAIAVIRFLPKTKDDELPFVSYYSHYFKNEKTGKTYFERSLSSLGKPDPVGEANSKLWASGIESNKKQASAQKRKQNFVANVLVVSCPDRPELEGQVMPFKFGKAIYNFITEAVKEDPVDPTKKVFNPFCPFTGANFKLRVYKDGVFPSYDKSGFMEPSQLADSEEDMVAILNKMEPLAPYVAPEKFKTYEQLQRRYLEVTVGVVSTEDALGSISTAPAAPKDIKSEEEPAIKQAPATADDSDIEDYFKSLMG